jgi:serine/threonine protein kinase
MSPKEQLVFETTFNQFKELEKIGEGGAGLVYKVTDGNTIYAAKYLNPNKVSTKTRKRFYNEITFCEKNIHQNVITVVDHGLLIVKGVSTPFYIMPYYPTTLRKLMESSISYDKVLYYFSDILNGVEAAHLKSIWHRDLKPENILIDPSTATLVVSDFGIAHFTQEDLYTLVETRADDRLGNFQYSAPEQRARGKEVDRRADIFSLGLILNEMFTHNVPQGTGYPKIVDVSSDYAYLDDLVDWMIHQLPEQRPGTIDVIKQQLIVRGNDFVSQQKLNQLKNTVIPTSVIDDPLVTDPVRLEEVDYRKGELIFRMSRPVNDKWERAFKSLINFEYFPGYEPKRFTFHQDKTARVPSDGRSIDLIAELAKFFKIYIEKANMDYRGLIEKEQRQKEEEQQKTILEQIHEEEIRKALRNKVKLN